MGQIRFHVIDRNIGYLVLEISQSGYGGNVDIGIVGKGEEGTGRHLVRPGRHSALGIQKSGNPMGVGGTEKTVLNVFLPAPDQLDGPPDGLTDLGCFPVIVGLGPAAQSTPQIGGVNVDLIGLQTRNFLDGLQGPSLGLGGRPDVTAIFTHIHGAVHGFHVGVGEVGKKVLHLEPLVGLFKGCRDITILACRDAGFVQQAHQVLFRVLGVQIRTNALVPLGVEGRSPFPGSIQCVRTNGDPPIDLDHLLDAPGTDLAAASS